MQEQGQRRGRRGGSRPASTRAALASTDGVSGSGTVCASSMSRMRFRDVVGVRVHRQVVEDARDGGEVNRCPRRIRHVWHREDGPIQSVLSYAPPLGWSAAAYWSPGLTVAPVYLVIAHARDI